MGQNQKPPFQITNKILELCLNIQEILTDIKNIEIIKPSIKLRKQNKIKTIHHSLAIEGSTLTLDQVTDIVENKRVIGPKKEINEVQNAIQTYELIQKYNPFNEKDFLKAHKNLMNGLVSKAGAYRHSSVGILKGSMISHVAPQSKIVPKLMSNLFSFIKNDKEVSLLIKACIFHYELEFIHPFEDGNGRMGRLWQQVILMKYKPIFEYLSVESLIYKNQKKYYSVLEKCDKSGDSTYFIEFSLELILQSLLNFTEEYKTKKLNTVQRLELAKEHFKSKNFSRKDYLKLFSELSTATGSRDLASGVSKNILYMSGSDNKSVYRFIY